jgi:transglutaminase-like putative cysteine protease
MSRKPPPLLLGAALLFWGLQTGFLFAGLVMALVLEAAHLLKLRWEFSADDFARLWIFCIVAFLATIVYAFTSSQAPSDILGFFQNPGFLTQRNAGVATSRTAAALVRWLPMSFFVFIAAQQYSVQGAIPLQTVNLLLSRRWRKARKLGPPPGPARAVNVGYIYFALCLFAASIHVSEGGQFFWGVCALLGWALWPQRSPRFALPVWAAVLGLTIAAAYFGQRGLGHLQTYISNLNPPWLAGYGHNRFDAALSRTELGSIGRIKTSAKIVIRLDTVGAPAPPLLREASYPNFKHRTWYIDVPEKRSFEDLKAETNETTYVLVKDKTNASSAQIACYLAGGKALLPLPSASGRLENLMAFSLKRNNFGAILDEGPGLVIFRSFYGPGASIDSPADMNEDLSVPAVEQPALNQIAADLHLDEQTPAQRLKTIAGFFARQFTYSTWQNLDSVAKASETPLARFLLRTHKGHCEYFATAGVLLLRRAGFPARYAVGYAVHEPSGTTGFVVRQRDAHAWCLLWDPAARTWHDLDFTPGSWLDAETQHASIFQGLTDAWSRVVFEFSKFRWGQSQLRQYILWGLVPVLATLLYQIIVRSRRHKQEPDNGAFAPADWPGLDSEFFLLERKLAGRGLRRQRDESLAEWLVRASTEPSVADLRSTLLDLLGLHYRYRFDPLGLNVNERESLRREALACVQRL